MIARAVALGVVAVVVARLLRARRVDAVVIPEGAWSKVRVVGDGNCLFRALAHPTGHHAALRRELVGHMRREWARYAHFVAEEERDDYLADMARAGTWGDELVLLAFSECRGVRVRVHDAHPPHKVISEYGVQHPITHRLLYDGEHYDTLVP